jgi:AcrR family transcriptional regulator
MPTPARTSTDAIVDAGRQILEEDGLEALTMQAVARAVGVRPPSLYKHLRGRDELVGRIANQAAEKLEERLNRAVRGRDPGADLAALAAAYRSFALANPRAYALLFAPGPEAWHIDAELNARISGPLLTTAERLAGPSDALPAARMAVAWAHGFVSMELAGAFRLGGDVETAFAYGVRRLVTAIDARRSARTDA